MSRAIDQAGGLSYEFHKELQKAVSSASGLFETNIRCLAHITKMSEENEKLKAEIYNERKVFISGMSLNTIERRMLRLQIIALTA